MWWMIPAVAGMGLTGYGMYQSGQLQEAGAEGQATIEKISRDYQMRVFQEGMERQKPFYEAGREAIPEYEKALKGEIDPTTGLTGMESRMVAENTGSMSDHVQNLVQQRIVATGNEKTKGRLMDLMQTGLGQAGSAGQSAVNLGTGLARSYGQAGSALSAAQLGSQMNRQNIFMGALENLSGIPALYSMYGGGGQQSAPSPIMSANPYGSVAPYQARTSITGPTLSPMLT